MSTVADVSPSEITMEFVSRQLDVELVPGGVVVGRTTNDQQEVGCVQLVQSGVPRQEKYLPLASSRIQVRCLAPTLAHTEQIARHVSGILDRRNRVKASQPSTGQEFLIHSITVTAGPSMHYDSEETWEVLLFADLMYGLDPL